MAAATENLPITSRAVKSAKITPAFPMAAGVEIFKGTMFCLDGSGNAVPASDTAGLTKVVAISLKHFDNTDGAAGDVEISEGEYDLEIKLNHTGLGAGDLMTQVVVSDDNTVTNTGTATNDIPAGELREIDGSEAWVFIGYGA